MNEDFFQIDKKEILSKFKDLANKNDERADEYNPKHARATDSPTAYFILDRVRALYHWVIEQIKIDLRRKYIDNEDLKEILNMNLNLNNEELYKLYKEKEEKI